MKNFSLWTEKNFKLLYFSSFASRLRNFRFIFLFFETVHIFKYSRRFLFAVFIYFIVFFSVFYYKYITDFLFIYLLKHREKINVNYYAELFILFTSLVIYLFTVFNLISPFIAALFLVFYYVAFSTPTTKSPSLECIKKKTFINIDIVIFYI